MNEKGNKFESVSQKTDNTDVAGTIREAKEAADTVRDEPSNVETEGRGDEEEQEARKGAEIGDDQESQPITPDQEKELKKDGTVIDKKAESAGKGTAETEKKEEEKKPETTEEKFERQFNISTEDLDSIEGFRVLSEGQQALIYENLNQIMLGRVQEEAGQAHKDATTEEKFLGRMWRGMFKNYYIAREEKSAAERMQAGGIEEHKVMLEELTGQTADGPDVIITEEKTLEVQYAGGFEDLRDGEEEQVQEFNIIAAEYSKLPYEYSLATASPAERKMYRHVKERYEKARKNILTLELIRHGGDERRAACALGDINRNVQMNQLLNTHPEVEEQLQKITDQKVWQRAVASVATERGAYLGGGFVGRKMAIALMGSLGATGALLAMPVAAALSGGVFAGLRAKKELNEREKLARKGIEDTSTGDAKEQIKELTLEMNPEAKEEKRLKKLIKDIDPKNENEIVEKLIQEIKPEKRKAIIKKVEAGEGRNKEIIRKFIKAIAQDNVEDITPHERKKLQDEINGLKAQEYVKKNIANAESLTNKIEIEIGKVDAKSSKEECQKALGKLQVRLNYTKQKIEDGLVDFGISSDRLANQYAICQKIGEAETYLELRRSEVGDMDVRVVRGKTPEEGEEGEEGEVALLRLKNEFPKEELKEAKGKKYDELVELGLVKKADEQLQATFAAVRGDITDEHRYAQARKIKAEMKQVKKAFKGLSLSDEKETEKPAEENGPSEIALQEAEERLRSRFPLVWGEGEEIPKEYIRAQVGQMRTLQQRLEDTLNLREKRITGTQRVYILKQIGRGAIVSASFAFAGALLSGKAAGEEHIPGAQRRGLLQNQTQENIGAGADVDGQEIGAENNFTQDNARDARAEIAVGRQDIDEAEAQRIAATYEAQFAALDKTLSATLQEKHPNIDQVMGGKVIVRNGKFMIEGKAGAGEIKMETDGSIIWRSAAVARTEGVEELKPIELRQGSTKWVEQVTGKTVDGEELTMRGVNALQEMATTEAATQKATASVETVSPETQKAVTDFEKKHSIKSEDGLTKVEYDTILENSKSGTASLTEEEKLLKEYYGSSLVKYKEVISGLEKNHPEFIKAHGLNNIAVKGDVIKINSEPDFSYQLEDDGALIRQNAAGRVEIRKAGSADWVERTKAPEAKPPEAGKLPEKPPAMTATQEQIKLATIGKGEGVEHVFISQLKKDPEMWGFEGDTKNTAAVNLWAGRQAHRIAINNEYVDAATGKEIRVFDVGPKGPEGNPAYVLEKGPDDTTIVREYIEGKPTGGEGKLNKYEYIPPKKTPPVETTAQPTTTTEGAAETAEVTPAKPASIRATEGTRTLGDTWGEIKGERAETPKLAPEDKAEPWSTEKADPWRVEPENEAKPPHDHDHPEKPEADKPPAEKPEEKLKWPSRENSSPGAYREYEYDSYNERVIGFEAGTTHFEIYNTQYRIIGTYENEKGDLLYIYEMNDLNTGMSFEAGGEREGYIAFSKSGTTLTGTSSEELSALIRRGEVVIIEEATSHLAAEASHSTAEETTKDTTGGEVVKEAATEAPPETAAEDTTKTEGVTTAETAAEAGAVTAEGKKALESGINRLLSEENSAWFKERASDFHDGLEKIAQKAETSADVIVGNFMEGLDQKYDASLAPEENLVVAILRDTNKAIQAKGHEFAASISTWSRSIIESAYKPLMGDVLSWAKAAQGAGKISKQALQEIIAMKARMDAI